MAVLSWLIPLGLTLAIALSREDLRPRMFWAGILALPVFVLPLLLFAELYSTEQFGWSTLLAAMLTSFSFGALAAAAYEVFLGKVLALHYRSRRSLIWLLAGPLAVVVALLAEQSLIVAVIIGLIVDLLIVIITQADLIWDVIFSGLAMGLLYSFLYLVNFRGLSGEPFFWFGSELSGLTVNGLPLEELVLIVLFGALWGPIYVAVKDHRTAP